MEEVDQEEIVVKEERKKEVNVLTVLIAESEENVEREESEGLQRVSIKLKNPMEEEPPREGGEEVKEIKLLWDLLISPLFLLQLWSRVRLDTLRIS